MAAAPADTVEIPPVPTTAIFTLVHGHGAEPGWVLRIHPNGARWEGSPMRFTRSVPAGDSAAAMAWAEQQLAAVGFRLRPWAETGGPRQQVFTTRVQTDTLARAVPR